jgi:predicted dehydrogenase/threonine dehydrogenase-like Zn-dependent dehydrogenase
MKQVIQNARGGELKLKSVPAPQVQRNTVLVRTMASLISAGTERQMVGFAQSTLLSKARARPDLVQKVLDKVHRDGAVATFKSVMARLDEPLPLGYSAAGTVMEVGAGLEGKFRVGQLVAMAGTSVANHAEFNVVPENLVVPVPADVSAEQASFCTLCSIALHSVRLVGPQLGDFVAVLGAGLVGQLVSQFARLAGARVIVLDYNAQRLELAKTNGAEAVVLLGNGNPAEAVLDVTHGKGCDSVMIAAATESSEPFLTAAEIARDRATVCQVGITGTEFPYRLFMQKELNIIVSRSYGPGRYDREFENKHVKYPAGYVRWTETDNLRDAARLMSVSQSAHLDIASLISHRFPFDRAEEAYELVMNGTEPHLGVVLEYGGSETVAEAIPRVLLKEARPAASARCVLGAIGAGNFGKTMILPALKDDARVQLHTLVTARGVSSSGTGARLGFAQASTRSDDVFDNSEISCVVVTTPHSHHASMVARALAAGKHVFVEKPLALSLEELQSVIDARNCSSAFFTVGFNRRFAPYVQEARKFLKARTGRSMTVIRVNAGQLPLESWQRDADEGQGRILGELCHFVDLALYLAMSPLVSVSADSAETTRGLCEDLSVTLRFADGSLATIVYTTLGDTSFSKELIECYKGASVCRIENFREITIVAGGKQVLKKKSMAQDKGHKAQMKAFVEGVVSGVPPLDEQSLIDSSLATLLVLDALRLGHPVALSDQEPATQ